MDTDTPTTTVSRPQRRYGADEQAEALAILAENNGNVAATSRETGIPEQTIREWKQGNHRAPAPELVSQRKAERATAWDALQDAGVAVALEKLPTASAKDAALIAAIAADKAAMLRGENTNGGHGPAIVVNVNPRSITLTADDIREAQAILAGVRPVKVEPLPELPDMRQTPQNQGEIEGEMPK